MNDIVLILILFCVLLLVCALCAVGGFFVGKANLPEKKPKPPHEPISEQQRLEIERRRYEDNNFLNYDGSEQKDFV